MSLAIILVRIDDAHRQASRLDCSGVVGYYREQYVPAVDKNIVGGWRAHSHACSVVASYHRRPSRPYDAGMMHVGFSPIR